MICLAVVSKIKRKLSGLFNKLIYFDTISQFDDSCFILPIIDKRHKADDFSETSSNFWNILLLFNKV